MSTKSILVTGCSAGGIGEALAVALAMRGHRVFATARDPAKVPESLSSLSNVTVLRLDVLSPASVADAVKAVSESGQGLDILVNNAGCGYAQPILDVDIARAQQLFDTNLWGPIRMIQAFSDLLITSQGRIVNVSSVGAILNTPWIATYAASKAALDAVSETLRLELSPFGVSVITIMAGTINSQFHANDSNFGLPPNSRYTPIKDIIASWASGEAKPKGCSSKEFAQSIVDDMLGGGGYAVKGVQGTLGWHDEDFFMSQGQGLKELSQRLGKDANGK
ncbi:hypothetical protein KVR01_009389 [Diaporthe batatas]|uniref:uncharacterized protein n=1 Tax=Diaporthe batatas TaxID=748121 RepID=UPI001D047804|nr:uncharacterized protein KVR01_009389 [Diaporthe batatas]KAG8161125.1 hypothetical protein KVR01_009389 [Diaporthe batatas]